MPDLTDMETQFGDSQGDGFSSPLLYSMPGAYVDDEDMDDNEDEGDEDDDDDDFMDDLDDDDDEDEIDDDDIDQDDDPIRNIMGLFQGK